MSAVLRVTFRDLDSHHKTASWYTAMRGALVTGVDLSAGAFSKARELESDQPLGISYLLGGSDNHVKGSVSFCQ